MDHQITIIQAILAWIIFFVPALLSVIRLYNRVGNLETDNTQNKDHLKTLDAKHDSFRDILADIKNGQTRLEVGIENIKENIKDLQSRQ